MQDSKGFYQGFLFMLLPSALVFLRSGFTKILEGKFPGILEGILKKFASDNPYPFYKSFLENTVIPNAKSVGTFIMWAELITALSIIIPVLYLLTQKQRNKIIELVLILGLILGIFLNVNFFLGGAWTSVSKEALNMIMIMSQAIGLVFVIKSFKGGQKIRK